MDKYIAIFEKRSGDLMCGTTGRCPSILCDDDPDRNLDLIGSVLTGVSIADFREKYEWHEVLITTKEPLI